MIDNNEKTRNKQAETARNLEVGQCVGDSENPEKKVAGHNCVSFAKMAKLLEYCILRYSLTVIR